MNNLAPAIAQDCFLKGVAEFNRQDYFDCHESFEMLWQQSTDEDERHYLQGILQIAVAFHHCQKQNSIGFSSLLAKGRGHLRLLLDKNWQSRNGSFTLAQVDLPHLLEEIENEELTGTQQQPIRHWPILLLIPPAQS